MDAGTLEIALAEGHARRRVQAGQHVGIVEDPAQVPGEHADVGQFGGAFDLGVAGEDLLDQGRARPRKSHDEDRLVRGRPAAGARGQKVGREQGLEPLHQGGRLVGLIDQLGSPQPGALRIVFE